MDAFRIAYVYVEEDLAGILQETDEGYRFAYDADYLCSNASVPISVTMPLSTDAYYSKTLFPFFDGLIPEGWMLNVISRNWKLDPNDRFGLLLVSCKDCIGNVSIHERRI